MATNFGRTQSALRERCRSHDQCARARPARRPSPHPAERSAPAHRLPALQLATVLSMDYALLAKNAVSTVRTIKTFGVPVVHSTVNVASGRGQPTLPELAGLLTDDKPLDRTTVNSWEDIEFLEAVRATGRRKLIICALWTEICMAFTALDALREGYEVYPVVDAIGGTSPEAHRAGLDRVIQAGGQPISWVSLAVELQRDWARQDTVQTIVEIVLTDRLLKEQ